MDIYCVRHTTVLNPKVCYGHVDVPLAASFAEEAKQIADRLSLPTENMRCYVSPAERCRRLAAVLAPKLPLHCDDRLREMHFGRWEGLAWDDVPRGEMDVWAADFVNLAVPEGESFTQLAARVKSFWDELTARPMDQVSLVVTHGGWMRALLSQLRQTRLADAFAAPLGYGAALHIKLGENGAAITHL